MTPRELVTTQFPNQVLISLAQAGTAIGLARQSCYNMHSRGTFPLPIHKIGSKAMISLTDLIAYLEKLSKTRSH